jgi:hypothetical protein
LFCILAQLHGESIPQISLFVIIWHQFQKLVPTLLIIAQRSRRDAYLRPLVIGDGATNLYFSPKYGMLFLYSWLSRAS